MQGERRRDAGTTRDADQLGQPGTTHAIGKRTLVEHARVADAPGPQAVQRKVIGSSDGDPARGPVSDAAIQQTAARGVAGGGGPMPHLAPIQQLFGRHDVSGVEAHVGGAAQTASRAIGAEAYATGNHVAFASPPDLHTAAHEAAHVVQQRAGVQLKGGVGEAGDPYEHHADAVADAVVQGRSAEELLDRHAGAGGGAAPRPGPAGAPVQARIVGHQASGDAVEEMQEIAKHLDDCVTRAADIVAATPTLDGVPDANTGYLNAWVVTFKSYIENPNKVPDFFFARYGYAIETLAMRFVGDTFGKYRLHQQVSHGHTRPDLVVEDGAGQEVAWLDITSEGSVGHVLKKQHSGWTRGRSFVAEIVYPMPSPSTLAAGSKTLTPEQRAALSKADAAAGEKAKAFELACSDFAVAIAADLLDAANALPGKQIARSRALPVVKATCERVAGHRVTARAAAGIVSLLDELKVGSELNSGTSWANWLGSPDAASAHRILVDYGKRKAGASSSATASTATPPALGTGGVSVSTSAARPAVDGPVDLDADMPDAGMPDAIGAGAGPSRFAWSTATPL